MDTTFANAYTKVIGNNPEVHKAVQNNTAEWDILLDPRFKAYWDYDHEYVEYVSLLATKETVDPRGFVKMILQNTTQVTNTTLSVQGVRVSVTATYRVDTLHLVVHGTESQYDDMLEMLFTFPNQSSVINALYPGPMLLIQGVAHPGQFLLYLVDQLNEVFGMASSRLLDISEKEMCSGSIAAVSVPLNQLFLLALANSWYMGHGFLPRDASGDIVTWEHLKRIRATSMQQFYGTSESQTVLVLSGLQKHNNDFITTILLGHFFELVLQQLFARNYRTCSGILTILDKTEAVLTTLGYDITFLEFVKRYDRIEAIASRRVYRNI